MKIELAIQSIGFSVRLNWMLSSLLQQEQLGEDKIVISVSYLKAEKFQLGTEYVLDFFIKNGLNIRKLGYDKFEEAIDRGTTRTTQIDLSKGADWIIFADSDMVYHPLFFADLFKQIREGKVDANRVNGADRHSMSIPFCIEYFDKLDIKQYPIIIPQVTKIVSGWPLKCISGKYKAVGFFQLVNRDAIIKKTGGVYTSKRRKDHRIGVYTSDIRFRKLMSKDGSDRDVNPLDLLPQWHLNHRRHTTELK